MRPRWSCWGLAAGAVLLVLTGCAKDAPQDYLTPEGPIAVEAHRQFTRLLWLAVVPVFVLVEGLLIVSVVRHRQRKGRDEPLEIPGRSPKLRWVVAPTLVLLFFDLFPLAGEAKTIFELASEPKDALQIEVYGHMWWWEFVYPEAKISTANELHIPTGRPVRLTLRTIEPGLEAGEGAEFAQGVIHSFWVPKLAGKQDVVPGRDNKMTIEADEPGMYRGQCAEYCNLSHANMRVRVFAQEPADFEAWVAEQKRPAVKPPSGPAAEGFALFNGEGGCVACHTVIGIDGALARTGPNLTHLKSRTTFAGAIFENTKANLTKWVRDPPAMKPMRPDEGTGMPDRGLSDDDVDKVVAYLETLK
ncbi:MAG: cytochrome c oxidase subunit II [Acidimicrobiia bacterium]